MCDVEGDPCDVWHEATPVARKAHTCEECRLPIAVGVRHTRITSLFEGSWSSTRVHTDCLALLKRISLEVCQQHVFYIGVEPLRARVLEHLVDEPTLARDWRDILRARRAEGVWPGRLVERTP